MRISVLVVTYGRPDDLARCLAAVREHETRHDVEIVTVHAPGDDASVAIVRARFPGVRVETADRANVSLQRNAGARAATGELLLYLDDDAWPAPGWIDALAAAFECDPGLDLAGGPVLEPDGALQMRAMAISRFARTRRVHGPDDVPPGFVFQVTGCNLAVRASSLRDAGGFDETYAYHLDDSDLAVRITDRGGRVGWVEVAAVHHRRAPGPRRATVYDRDWRSVARNDVVFAFRHVRRARWRLAIVPFALEKLRALRMLAWLLLGRFGPAAWARSVWGLTAGTFAGYRFALGEGRGT